MEMLHEWLDVACTTAVAAGQLVREQWLQPRQLTNKGFRDLVTDADIASQKLITSSIQNQFPDHGFITEEEDHSLPTDKTVQWIIDPVDGTTNYSRQVPLFSIAIAAMVANEIQVAVIYDPMRDELFSAAKGLGGKLNERPLRVSATTSLSEAIFSLDWSHQAELRQRTLHTLNNFAHQTFTMRALGSAALATAWIAAGRLDGYLNFNLKPWDIAAGALLIREADGQVTTEDGREWELEMGTCACVATNGRIHTEFLQHVAP